jgi:predicted RNA-binding protein associated with RNAse of E/G family
MEFELQGLSTFLSINDYTIPMPTINLTFIRPSKRTDIFVHGLIRDTEKLIVSDLTFDMPKPFAVDGRPVIFPGDRGLLFEYAEGYEIIAAVHDLRLTGHYININLPFERTPDGYRVKDLFLDLWVWSDGRYHVLDEDEYAEACEKGWLTKQEQAFALRIKEKAIKMITNGRFPPKKVSVMTTEWLKALKGSLTSEG